MFVIEWSHLICKIFLHTALYVLLVTKKLAKKSTKSGNSMN